MKDQIKSTGVSNHRVRYYNYLTHKKESIVFCTDDIDLSIKRFLVNMTIEILSVKKVKSK